MHSKSHALSDYCRGVDNDYCRDTAAQRKSWVKPTKPWRGAPYPKQRGPVSCDMFWVSFGQYKSTDLKITIRSCSTSTMEGGASSELKWENHLRVIGLNEGWQKGFWDRRVFPMYSSEKNGNLEEGDRVW